MHKPLNIRVIGKVRSTGTEMGYNPASQIACQIGFPCVVGPARTD